MWHALEALHAEAGIRQSVLSGNTTAVARLKVEAFGLDRYLDLSAGAYGDDDRDRSELVGIARKRAAQQLGVPVPAGEVVLIGDTPADVEAALVSGARIIAIASGTHSTKDLRAAGAQSTLENLTNMAQLRKALKR